METKGDQVAFRDAEADRSAHADAAGKDGGAGPLSGTGASDQRRPIFLEQAGQAPQPWPASTFSAMRICSALLAFAGLPEPP